jgi:hypothetical protein
LCHLAQHLGLAVAEGGHPGRRHGGAAGEQALHNLGVDRGTTLGHRGDRPEELVEIADTVLEQVGEPSDTVPNSSNA